MKNAGPSWTGVKTSALPPRRGTKDPEKDTTNEERIDRAKERIARLAKARSLSGENNTLIYSHYLIHLFMLFRLWTVRSTKDASKRERREDRFLITIHFLISRIRGQPAHNRAPQLCSIVRFRRKYSELSLFARHTFFSFKYASREGYAWNRQKKGPRCWRKSDKKWP